MASDLSALGDLVIEIGGDLSPLERSLNQIPDVTRQAAAELDKLFGSGILTMPRRTIIYRNLHGFLSDKLKYFVLESDDHFYVEYLNNDDLFLIDKIPDDKWILSKYNARSNING